MPNELKIYGEIGNDVTIEMVRSAIAEMDTDQPLTVWIDSPGGAVDQGFSMFNELKKYGGKKTAIVDSSAMSIASYIALACDEVEMTPNGYFMIHNPMVATQGDDEELVNQAGFVKKLRDEMVGVYAARTGLMPEEIVSLMKKETYFDARESVAIGLADRVQLQAKATRIAARYFKSMPYGIVASLRCEAPGGDVTSPEDLTMSEKPKVAATVKQIKAIHPSASSDFIVKAVDKELTPEEVQEMAMEELAMENEELKAQVAAMEEELETAKAKAMEVEEEAQAMEEEETTAKARARGNQPVAVATSGSEASATSRWREVVTSYTAKGLSKVKAVQLANRNNPGLRQKMLEEVAASR